MNSVSLYITYNLLNSLYNVLIHYLNSIKLSYNFEVSSSPKLVTLRNFYSFLFPSTNLTIGAL